MEPTTVSTIAPPPMPPVESTDAFAFIPGSYRQWTTIRAHAAPEPPWMQPAVDRVLSLAKIDVGWGGPQTRRLQRDALRAAFGVLGMVMSYNSKSPQCVLTNEGGLQMEWHAAGVDLEIEVRADASAEVIIEDPRNGLDVDGTLGEHFDLVRRLLARRLTA